MKSRSVETKPTELDLTPKMFDALQEARAAIDERDRIAATLQEAERARRRLETEFESARRALAASESAAALSGGEPDAAARSAVRGAREAIDMANARISGLQSMLRTAEDRMFVAAAEVKKRQYECQRAVIDAFRPEFDAAVAALSASVRKAHAILTALNVTTERLIEVNVLHFDTSEPIRNLAPLFEQNSWRPTFLNDPAANAIYERLKAFGNGLSEIVSEVDRISNGRARESVEAARVA